MKNVIVVIGAGSIGQAVARRVSAGKHVLLAGLRELIADPSSQSRMTMRWQPVSSAT